MRAAADVISRNVGDEVVLLDLKRGVYFGLDAIGSRVWTLLCDGHDEPQIAAALAREYDASIDTIQADIRRLLTELRDEGLVLE